VTWRRDQGGHKPIHDDAGQLGMSLEQIGSVGSDGGNPGVFKTIPGSLLTRVVHEPLARVGADAVDPFHHFFGGKAFIIVGHDEQPRQLRCLPQELLTRQKGFSGKQHQRFHLGGMPARR